MPSQLSKRARSPSRKLIENIASSTSGTTLSPSAAAAVLNNNRTMATFNVYLHVNKLAKKPKDPSPTISKFPINTSTKFNLQDPLKKINKHIVEFATKDKSFFNEMKEYSEFDADSNIFLFENNKKKMSSETDPTKLMKKWRQHHISRSSSDEENERIFKVIKKNSLRKVPLGEEERFVLDVGIIMHKETSKRKATSSSPKNKKKKEDETAPDILRVKLMQPVWVGNNGVNENATTAVIKEFDIDFTEFSRSNSDSSSDEESTTTSISNNKNSNNNREYLRIGTYVAVRATVANEILCSSSLIKSYDGRVGKNVSTTMLCHTINIIITF